MRSDRRHERAFVVRLDPGSDPGSGPLEGLVEHVASGESARFVGADSLFAFLARMIARRGVADDGPG